MKVTAKATRAGDWWAVEVPEVPGAFTQAKRLDQIPDMVRDAVALMTGEPSLSIDVEVVPVIDESIGATIDSVTQKREQAATLAREATEDMATLARTLTEVGGMSVRDVGEILGISYQRVSQLLNPQATVASGSSRPSRKVRTTTRSAKSGRFVNSNAKVAASTRLGQSKSKSKA